MSIRAALARLRTRIDGELVKLVLIKVAFAILRDKVETSESIIRVCRQIINNPDFFTDKAKMLIALDDTITDEAPDSVIETKVRDIIRVLAESQG